MCVCVCVCMSTTTPAIAGRGKIVEKQQSNSYHLIYTEILLGFFIRLFGSES